MLTFRWNAQHAGAPDAPEYQTAVDELRGEDGGTLLRLPKTGTGLATSPELDAYVKAWTDRRGTGRAVVMVHGFAFDPGGVYDPTNDDDPFNGVYASPAKSGVESWLPIVGEMDEQGHQLANIAVAFCWTSIGSMANYGQACWSNLYQYPVFDLAPLAARALACVIAKLVEHGVSVDIFAHSLGTRTALEAIGILVDATPPMAVRRAVLVGGAQFSIDARDISTRAQTQVINIASQSDEVLFWGATKGCHPFRYNNTQEARVIGRDGMMPTPRWIDLQVDRRPSQQGVAFDAWFQARYGCTLTDDPDKRGRHWAYYRQPGNRVILSRMFLDDVFTPAALRASGIIEGVVRGGGYGNLTAKVPQTPWTCNGRSHPPPPFGTPDEWEIASNGAPIGA